MCNGEPSERGRGARPHAAAGADVRDHVLVSTGPAHTFNLLPRVSATLDAPLPACVRNVRSGRVSNAVTLDSRVRIGTGSGRSCGRSATLRRDGRPRAGRELRREALAAGRGGARQDRRGADREPGGERRDRPRLRGAREGACRPRRPRWARSTCRRRPTSSASRAGCGRSRSGSRASRTRSTGSRSAWPGPPAARRTTTGCAAVEERLDEIARDLAALREAVAPSEEPVPRAQERLTVTEA